MSTSVNPLVPLLILPAVPSTYGALLIGIFFALMLHGFSLHQGYHYLRTYVRDHVYLKCYVILILLVDTFHSVDLMVICYGGLVSDFFKPEKLFDATWYLLPGLTGLEIVLCQGFFAYRVYKIHHQYRYMIAATIIPIMLAMLGFSVAAAVKAFQTSNWIEFVKDTWLISAALCVALGLDTVLTIILIVALRRRRTAFHSTNSKLDALIAYAICTGLMTDVFNILAFAFSKSSPTDMRYSALVLVVVKVYANSVLAALNLRSPRRLGDPNTEHSVGNASNVVDVAIELASLPKATSRPAAPVAPRLYIHSSSNTSVIDIKV
ncbi:hypothetical protein K466DRAFT_309112 [Polyporus arcularius HHB13444]|uniref:DUF6534 domain-containing protein n=1 Tax=Polyporus arcularius HHB13444 TaxID=1314778 RepID=A0A5C3PP60_9APHY|nr:hypothetical protein K466DRAFT_309112 [Polyporus arcularius HHB13444]